MPRPHLEPPPSCSFQGSFAEFYATHIEPNLPTPQAASHIHHLLKEYVEDTHTDLFIIRRTRSIPRGVVMRDEHQPAFICTDNEPALWFYGRAYLDNFHAYATTLHDAIARSVFPIGMAVSKRDGESKDDWRTWGRAPWERKFGASRLYHAHLFDASKGLDYRVLNRRLLKIRMTRLLHPANHFPMPTHLSSGVHYVSSVGSGDLSELPGVKRFIANAFSERYKDIWSDFLNLVDDTNESFPGIPDLTFDCTKTQPGGARRTSETNGARRIRLAVPAQPQFDRRENNPMGLTLTYSRTRFLINEELYQDLTSGARDLVIHVSGGSGQNRHPQGTYRIPHAAAVEFIEEKRRLPTWKTSRQYSQHTIPLALQQYFYST